MTDWVRFHSEIRRGAKKGIPRAERFVYMELSQEARANGGYIVLPVDMSDIDAVYEILGGNREEVVEAVKRFSKGPDPSLIFEGPRHRRILRVVHWLKWNSQPEPAGSSTPRVQKFRASKGLAKPRPPVDEKPPAKPLKLRDHVDENSPGEFPVTRTVKPRTGKSGENMEPHPKLRTDSSIPRNGHVTAAERSGNGFQIRSDQIREEEIRGDPEDVVSYPNHNLNRETPPRSAGGSSVGVLDQDPVVLIYDHYLVGWRERNPHGGRPPGLTPYRRKLLEARLAEGLGVDDLKVACDGIWRSDWHVEKGFTLLEHVVRDREHVERFMQVPQSSRVQTSDGYTAADAAEAQARFLAEAEEQIAAAAAAGYKDPLA